MLIKNEFEVAAPVEKVWEFFGDIPQVASCLPGTASSWTRPAARRGAGGRRAWP